MLKASGINASQVKGVGFDATCSLAVSDLQGNPIIVTGGSELGNLGERNVILWADHRAWKEAKLINGTGSKVLKYVGGTMSVRLLQALFHHWIIPRHAHVFFVLSSRWKYQRLCGSRTIWQPTVLLVANSLTSLISVRPILSCSRRNLSESLY